jgi:hypothetical protein
MGIIKAMTRVAIVCAAVFMLFTAAAAGAQAAQPDDCDAKMQKLDASNAEGEERLAEKNAVIDFCGHQYVRDATIKRLVKACAKFEEQPVLKQQFVADCELAAFGYANALRALQAEGGQ